MKNNLLQISVTAVLILLAVTILNPFHLWMPDMAHMAVLAALLVGFALFAVFVVREQARDEREEFVRMQSGRVGYLAGALVLVLGIALKGISGAVDPWLIYALLALLLGKLATHLYHDLR